jgi:immune inhibitor A
MPLARPYFVVCAVSCLATVAGAQGRQRPVPRWEIPGLDITPNGGWRVRARAVAATRTRLLAQRNFAMLNAAPAGPAAVNAVTGTLRVPVVMFRYQDSPSGQYSRDTAQYNAALFAAVPPAGRPYTLRSFYEQLSNGLFSLQGAAAGWEALAGNESAYTGAAGACPGNPYGTGNCNGVWSGAAYTAMQAGLREALTHADSTIDFGQFDNNGPDGIPNSPDDDGVVDAALFLHPSLDGACLFATNNHLWSHRGSLTDTGTEYTTNDNRAGGGKIVVNDYILQSGLGSSLPGGSPCGTDAIMPIGTAAHELGHILALPDLYDVSGSTEGIGEFGLMGSGNYTTGNSPSRYDPWSLQQMGWTTVVPLTTTGTYSVGPVPIADTVFYVNVQGTNLRDEHLLIENRQEVLADSAMLRVHCALSSNAPGCAGGLLIYHVDGQKACMINVTVCDNSVNAGPIHGVAIEEGDGLRDLWNGDNRGDGGDLYPGTTGNTAFSFRTEPAALDNRDSSFVGFAVDSIRQLVPNGEMAFRLRFGGLTVVQASDTTAKVQVDGLRTVCSRTCSRTDRAIRSRWWTRSSPRAGGRGSRSSRGPTAGRSAMSSAARWPAPPTRRHSPASTGWTLPWGRTAPWRTALPRIRAGRSSPRAHQSRSRPRPPRPSCSAAGRAIRRPAARCSCSRWGGPSR